MYKYPYGNSEELNLDWFLNQFQTFTADVQKKLASATVQSIIEYIAGEYDTAKNYNENDYCVYENSLYRATTSTTGVFNSDAWVIVKLSDDITTIWSELADLTTGLTTAQTTASNAATAAATAQTTANNAATAAANAQTTANNAATAAANAQTTAFNNDGITLNTDTLSTVTTKRLFKRNNIVQCFVDSATTALTNLTAGYTHILTLPENYRPVYTFFFPILVYINATPSVTLGQIQSNGRISILTLDTNKTYDYIRVNLTFLIS